MIGGFAWNAGMLKSLKVFFENAGELRRFNTDDGVRSDYAGDAKLMLGSVG